MKRNWPWSVKKYERNFDLCHVLKSTCCGQDDGISKCQGDGSTAEELLRDSKEKEGAWETVIYICVFFFGPRSSIHLNAWVLPSRLADDNSIISNARETPVKRKFSHLARWSISLQPPDAKESKDVLILRAQAPKFSQMPEPVKKKPRRMKIVLDVTRSTSTMMKSAYFLLSQ